jgi:hypothetical protein
MLFMKRRGQLWILTRGARLPRRGSKKILKHIPLRKAVQYDFNLYNNYIMDSLFNRCTIPESTPLLLIVRPSGKTWVTGMASRFDIDCYNPQFFNNTGLKEREFVHIIDQLNDLIYSNWPCMLCQCLGYSLCLCTLSLSFLYPSEDVNRAEKVAR